MEYNKLSYITKSLRSNEKVSKDHLIHCSVCIQLETQSLVHKILTITANTFRGWKHLKTFFSYHFYSLLRASSLTEWIKLKWFSVSYVLSSNTIFIAIKFLLSTLAYLIIIVPPVLNHSLIELMPDVISSCLCELVLLGILNFEHEIAHWYLTVLGPH